MSRVFREPIGTCLRLGVWVGEETWVKDRARARAPFLLAGVLLPIWATRTSLGTLLGLLGHQQDEPDTGSSQHAADVGSWFSFLQQKLNIQ